jgi:tetratricopeptide (TPR) repeat protein
VPKFRYEQSVAMARAEMMKLALGDVRGATAILRMALGVLKRLADDFPACPDYRRQYAQTHVTLGKHLLGLRAYDEAEAAFREALRLWTKTAADFPQNREFRTALGTAHIHLGLFLIERERLQEAEVCYAETIRIHQRLAADVPHEPEYQVALAADYYSHAQLLERQQRLSDAVESYSRTVSSLEAGLRMKPRQRDWLWRLQNTLQQRSAVLLALQRSAEYERDVQQAKEIGDRLQPPLVHLSRIRQQIQERQFAPALAEADDVAAGDDLTGAQWHELAGLYAQLAETVEATGAKESAATSAVEALRKAIAAGYASPVPFAADPQFRSLAARADFKNLPAPPSALAAPR